MLEEDGLQVMFLSHYLPSSALVSHCGVSDKAGEAVGKQQCEGAERWAAAWRGGSQCSPREGETHHRCRHGCGLGRNGSSLLGILEAFCATGRVGERPVVKADHLDMGATGREAKERSKLEQSFILLLLTHLARLITGSCLPSPSHPNSALPFEVSHLAKPAAGPTQQ